LALDDHGKGKAGLPLAISGYQGINGEPIITITVVFPARSERGFIHMIHVHGIAHIFIEMKREG
jgi:hypothetical protein